jgi:putative tryptophan/tyrosine transport system substrate-binding protein
MKRREFITLVGGAAAAWPLTAHAQQVGKMYRVGVLSAGLDLITPQRQAFEQGLREEGFVEHRNLIFERRLAEGDLERLPAMAAELVELNVDVIVVMGPAPMQAAKAATTKIPIVMDAGSIDPVGEGLIASFARPGRNITGSSHPLADLGGQRVSIWLRHRGLLIISVLPGAGRNVSCGSRASSSAIDVGLSISAMPH